MRKVIPQVIKCLQGASVDVGKLEMLDAVVETEITCLATLSSDPGHRGALAGHGGPSWRGKMLQNHWIRAFGVQAAAVFKRMKIGLE